MTTALLWNGFAAGFVFYFGHVTDFSMTYGSLGGVAITLVFFGFNCLALGYLIFRSTFLPRIIGVLLAIEGLSYLINSFANFLAPEFAARFFPFLAASAVAEVSLCLWLLVMGVNVQRWKAQSRAAGEWGS